jgi:hypothetical protein
MMRRWIIAACVARLACASAFAQGPTPPKPILDLSASAGSGSGISVKSAPFNAVGNGTTYDTAAIQAAANAVPATGAMLEFPAGSYLINATISLKSHTHVHCDGATILADATWPIPSASYYMFSNQNHAATTITDSDIDVDRCTFDYGTFGPIVPAGGGKHAINFRMAQDLSVTSNVFQLRGAEDAVAGLATYNFRVSGNSAYQFRNAPWDFWEGPVKTRVIDNYAETSSAAQLLNYNPKLDGTANASDLIATGNQFNNTGTNYIGLLLEPLATLGTVDTIDFSHNEIINGVLAIRGAVTNATIIGNRFIKPRGGNGAILNYGQLGGVPNNITVIGNTIVDPDTIALNQAVLRSDTAGTISTYIGNQITGSSYGTVPGIATGPNSVVVSGNYVSNGINNTPAAVIQTSTVRVPSGSGVGAYDTLGGAITWLMQSDNNFVLRGTDAGGSLRVLASVQQRSSTAPWVFSIPAQLASYTVSTLPSCVGAIYGSFARVSDATAPTYNGALTAGGTVSVPVYCDPVSLTWKSH